MSASSGSEVSKFFLRSVADSLSSIRAGLRELMEVLPGEDHKQKSIGTNEVLVRMARLKLILAESDLPPWFGPLHRLLDKYKTHPTTFGTLVFGLLEVYPAVMSKEWETPIIGDRHGVDLDGILAEYAASAGIPKLFDTLIDRLMEIAASGAITDELLRRTLDRLIATLQHHQGGSFLSMQTAFSFGETWLRKYIVKKVASTQAGAALKETVDELRAKFEVPKGLKYGMHGEVPFLVAPRLIGPGSPPALTSGSRGTASDAPIASADSAQ